MHPLLKSESLAITSISRLADTKAQCLKSRAADIQGLTPTVLGLKGAYMYVFQGSESSPVRKLDKGENQSSGLLQLRT